MTTTAVKKTPVEAKWTLAQVQEKAALAQANMFLAAMTVIGKFGEEAHQEFGKLVRANKVEHYKSVGVKTPMDLVKAMAEFETNVFGSKIEISGEDNSATLTYNSCAMWNAMEKLGKLTPAQQEKMGTNFDHCMSELAKEFGWTSKTCMEGEVCTVTISK